jgi:aminopeptidase N
VDDRNAWYPFTRSTFATFDFIFRCPDNLRLVSTGELVSDQVQDGVRTVHRVTRVPEALAGFNLGNYDVAFEDHGGYRVECYANKSSGPAIEDIPKQMEALLDYYTSRWMPLPIHSIAVSPIPAQLGQGFPGLIYLSNVSYARPEDRPVNLRTPTYDKFFSDLLLPHEVAHQWWGNIVTSAEYRSAWINEAFANYSALQFVEKNRGLPSADSILNDYRNDLVSDRTGKSADSYGPLELGIRLMDLASPGVWHTITYEKGTWVMHMLHERLGDDGFLKLELRLLHDFADRPLTNENLRKLASDLVPAGQADKSLSAFFDTWVYGTGIPRLQITGQNIAVSDVDDDFTADVPLRCHAKGAAERVHWVHVSSGTNSLELAGGLACELPPPSEFLYVPAGKPLP